jgi:hypothetical protein
VSQLDQTKRDEKCLTLCLTISLSLQILLWHPRVARVYNCESDFHATRAATRVALPSVVVGTDFFSKPRCKRASVSAVNSSEGRRWIANKFL